MFSCIFDAVWSHTTPFLGERHVFDFEISKFSDMQQISFSGRDELVNSF